VKLSLCSRGDTTFVAQVIDGRVIPLQKEAGTQWRDVADLITEGLGNPTKVSVANPLSVKDQDLTFLAPIPRPPKLICIGLNYRDHAAETNMELPRTPVVFGKYASAVIGPDEPIVLPRISSQVDYEAELAVVIGRRGKNVPVEQAMDFVAGYTIINDVSARDLQMESGQWLKGKTCDTFAPMGPWVVTTDEVADPHDLHVSLRLNGETMQDSNTKQMIFPIPELISYLSRLFTLEVGDVIATGTPSGVGFARRPPIFLQDGDLVEIEIEGIGVLRNPVVKER
jgi:2-keto-4-pentenoate hydratase/2-oxohepta-3-ene-1,7-dioic acid hydratase in catechol pathway